MKITRKGYYTIEYDGELLKRSDGSTRQATTRDDCYEYISEDGREGKFTIFSPNREVEVETVVAPEPTPESGITVVLNGPAEITLEAGDTYTELGARVATDVGPPFAWTDLDITVTGEVDETTEGVYEITYTATDDTGNTASEVRVVTINATDITMDTRPGGALTRPAAAYRTVIKFGDTQQYPTNQSQFTAMIDWIIANKDIENIDFVIFPGDIIDFGVNLPLDFEGEALFGNGQAPYLDAVEPQWSYMTTQIDRLETAGIPYVLCRGNHDNIGLAADITANLDVNGFPFYFSDAHFDTMETNFAPANGSADRYFVHETGGALVSGLGFSSGLSHVFRVKIGDNIIRVISPTYPNLDDSDNEVNWAIARAAENQDIPARMLTHWAALGTPDVFNDIVEAMDTVAPQLFASDEGHLGQANLSTEVRLVGSDSDHKILESTTDFSNAGGTGTPTPEIVRERYYLDESGDVTELEVDIYNVSDQTVRSGVDEFITRQAFSIAPPTSADPYDLSGFTIGHTVTWPTAPSGFTTTTTISSGDSSSAFATAVAISNSQITVEAGYSGTGASTWGDDIDVIMDNTATITTDCNFGTASRIRWTGGSLTGTLDGNGPTDLLIDNLNVTSTDASSACYLAQSNPITRVALINSTFRSSGTAGSTGWGVFLGNPASDHTDLIIANCDIGTTNYQGLRVSQVNRFVLVDSFVEASSAGNAGTRLHYNSRNVHHEDCISVGPVFFPSGTTSDNVEGAVFTNIYRYADASFRGFFSMDLNEPTASTGTVTDCTVYWVNGSGTFLEQGSFAYAGTNSQLAWDGSTITWSDIPGKTAQSDFGADH